MFMLIFNYFIYSFIIPIGTQGPISLHNMLKDQKHINVY